MHVCVRETHTHAYSRETLCGRNGGREAIPIDKVIEQYPYELDDCYYEGPHTHCTHVVPDKAIGGPHDGTWKLRGRTKRYSLETDQMTDRSHDWAQKNEKIEKS